MAAIYINMTDSMGSSCGPFGDVFEQIPGVSDENLDPQVGNNWYCQISNIRRTKSQNLNGYRRAVAFAQSTEARCFKSRMKM